MLRPGITLHVYGIEGSVSAQEIPFPRDELAGVLEDGGFSYLVFTADQRHALAVSHLDVIYIATLKYEDWLDGDIAAPLVEGGLTIVPPWCDVPRSADTILRITPSLVFGTGAHPTSRRCLRLIESISREAEADIGWTALDLGCGSGVLGLAAARFGASRVWGCDICELAVEVARANAVHNELHDRVTFSVAPAIELARPADLVMANLPPSALGELLEHPTLDHAKWIVASGLLRSHHFRLVESLASRNRECEVFVDGCWYTVLARLFE